MPWGYSKTTYCLVIISVNNRPLDIAFQCSYPEYLYTLLKMCPTGGFDSRPAVLLALYTKYITLPSIRPGKGSHIT